MNNVLTSEQRQQVFLDIDHRLNVYFWNVARLGKEGSYSPSSIEVLIEMVIEPAGLGIEDFRYLNPMKKIEKTLECCKKVGLDEFNTKFMINIWSDQAYELLSEIKAP